MTTRAKKIAVRFAILSEPAPRPAPKVGPKNFGVPIWSKQSAAKLRKAAAAKAEKKNKKKK